MPLSESQKSIVTATVPLLAEHGVEVTSRFYETLLKEHSELKNVFSRTDQVTLRQQTALASALYAYAAHIDDLTPILPVVEKINQRHASLNITPKQYAVVGEGVLRAMGQVLGDLFTEEVRDAWAAAYQQLASIMSGREEEIYASQEQTTNGWRGWREMRVMRKVAESEDIISFYLEPVSGSLPTFKAGQYVSIKLFVPSLGYEQTRQYSLSDAPATARSPANNAKHGKQYRITVKKDEDPQMVRDGVVSSILHEQVRENDVIRMSHPAGEFFLDKGGNDESGPVVLISAGVGMTPMMSMLRSITQQCGKRQISWVHVTRSAAMDAFADDIRRLACKYKNLQTLTFHSSPTRDEVEGCDFDRKGRPDFDKLDHETLCLDDARTVYYICGPDSFMRDARAGLRSRGVPDGRIEMELFSVGSVNRGE